MQEFRRCAMKTNRLKYVYVVVGICEPEMEQSYTIVSEAHAGHSTMEKAQGELQAILDEIRQEAVEQEYEITYEMDNDSLNVEFPSGSNEYYKIHKILVN